MLQHHLEKRISDDIKAADERIFSLRQERIRYYAIEDSKLIPDARYSEQIQKLLLEERTLMLRIATCLGAKARASEIVREIKGADRSFPLSWLSDREANLKKETERLFAECNVIKGKIEANKGLDTTEWRSQLSGYEEQYKNIKSEYEKLKVAREEVFKVLQTAGA